MTGSLELNRVTLGFVPLTDCAPLVMALDKGFFARHGLSVTLSREASWANIRDKVAVGLLDGAQMPAGMPLAATGGVGRVNVPMLTGVALGLNGNAITVSETLFRQMEAADPAAVARRPADARALKPVIAARREAGRPKLTFGVVLAVSSHAYQLRTWLAAAGIDPDRDVQLVVVPPPHMVGSLKAGEIDGYCVGEPWNTQAVHEGIGRIVVTGYELWNNSPEKVLGVTAAWAAANPNAHRALIRALIETARWLDVPANREETAATLSRVVGVPEAVLRASLTGSVQEAPGAPARPLPDFIVFHRYAATFPWRSHALWFLAQMVRWGQLPAGADLAGIAASVYRADLHRAAAAELGEPVPLTDGKPEGAHAGPWTLTDATSPIAMGADRFFEGRRFDPADPLGGVPSRSFVPA
ncbi:CmpA/NrtA family ABC transporter substrate-binding protein [Azospirillum sp.]|uniref:CmpA/NrtA family ABC transporter substrate-binding protein n=1 Tax=Azospirillum sp. TaxID=34012 RepID=UPI003D7417D3